MNDFNQWFTFGVILLWGIGGALELAIALKKLTKINLTINFNQKFESESEEDSDG